MTAYLRDYARTKRCRTGRGPRPRERRYRKPVTDKEEQRIAELEARGLGPAAIAERLHRGASTVSRRMGVNR